MLQPGTGALPLPRGAQGLELGQLLVVLVLRPLVQPLVRWRNVKDEGGALVSRSVRSVGSIAAAALGLFWFAQRL